MRKPLGKRFLIQKEDLNFPEVQELVTETAQRVLLLIKARWVFIVILIIYSLFALALYKASGIFHIVQVNYLVPSLAFVVIIAYNTWYHLTYKWFSRIRGINQLQLIFDVLFVTILIHYSGGILSWLWVLYPLLVIEAAFLFEDKQHTLVITFFCIGLYGLLLIFEHYHFLSSIEVPIPYGIDQNFSYKILFISWFSFIILCFAFVGTYLMGVIRGEEKELQKQVVIDGLTELYNRSYFFYRLNSEIVRSQRFGHKVSVLLIDLDGFKAVNDKLGHLEGDSLLHKVAEVFKHNLRLSAGDPSYDVDIPCRYGGDEFTIILPETEEFNAVNAAERIRKAIVTECKRFIRERSKDKIRGDRQLLNLTLSIGIATFPVHAGSTDELIKKADEALYQAKGKGKNKVVVATV